MANVYVRSGAAGAGTGADWANAYTTLNAAFTAKAAGDVFWVSEDHAETTASTVTMTSPGTIASPCFVYCVDHAGSVPPVSANLRTTATITATGSSQMNVSGSAYFYGVIIQSGSGGSGIGPVNLAQASEGWLRFDSCSIRCLTTGATSGISTGAVASGDCRVELVNTTLQFGAVGQALKPIYGTTIWKNTASALSGAIFPTTLVGTSTNAGNLLMEGIDLSALGAGNTIVGALASSATTIVKDCKLGASVTKAATPTKRGQRTTFIRTDSSATNYLSEAFDYTGTETTETTIVRTGGASDGTTTIAKKIVTTANSKWVLPFEALPIAIWNDSTSSVTVTVYGIWGGGAVPNNDDIWMDVEYLGSALTPQGSFATSTKADNLATASALTTDTSTWGGSTTKFKMTATFTPAQKGAIYIYIKAAAVSSTFYIDPKPVLS